MATPSILLVILAFAVVNVGVGLLVAYRMDRRGFKKDAVQSLDPPDVAVAPMAPQGTPTKDEALLGQWRQQLESVGLSDVPEVEVPLWVLYDAVVQLDRRLLDLDRAVDNPSASAELDSMSGDVQELTRPLREQLLQSSRYLKTGSVLTNMGETLVPLHDVLEDYARQLDELCARLKPQQDRILWQQKNPRREIYQQLSEFNHRLRDDLCEKLAPLITAAENGERTIPERWLYDTDFGLANRLGLEREVAHYRRSVPGETPVALVIVDVDRFQRVHRQLGVWEAEKLLESLAKMMLSVLRGQRGFDRVGRLSGPTLLVVLGDTTCAAAAQVAERLRQIVEASSFTLADRSWELTVSCGVVQWQPQESLADALRRLRLALAEARRSGRNRTCVDDGQRLEIVQPEPLGVKGQVVVVESDVTADSPQASSDFVKFVK